MENIDSFEKLLKGSKNLPTLPGIALRLVDAFQKNEPNIDEIGDIISSDPPLSAKILKIINSSFYSIPTNITSVHLAIKMLGLSSVKNLALSFSLVNKFNSMVSKTIDPSRFWKDSLIGAVSIKLMGEKIFPAFSGDVFFLGLLQNIGILTLSHCMPKQYDLVIGQLNKNGLQAHEAENQILGFNHMETGEYLIKAWGLPNTFYVPIGYHHHPEKLKSTHQKIITLTKILHLSSLYIELFNTASDMGLKLAIIENRAKAYGFDQMVDVHEIGQAVNQKASEIFPIFEIDFKDPNDYAQLLEAAKEELISLSAELINDLLNQRQEISLLRQQVGLDSMTDLINHQHFLQLLQQEISRSDRYKNHFSIIFADIDHFKSVNDTYGHLAGDRVIKAIAGCLRNELRKSDYIARYGGEEFAIILPETEKRDAWQVAERLRIAAGSLRVVYENNYIRPKMSFGIASFEPGTKISLDESIKRADSALYQAKKAGRDCCCAL